ncbi:MAG: hypothetical protein V3U45_04875 [bacterium]
MPEKKWKRTEKRVAKALGGKRITVAEDLQARGTLDDVRHPLFQVQVKHRKQMSLPQLQRFFDGVSRNASEAQKVPLLVVKRTGKTRLYAILRLEDLARLTGWSPPWAKVPGQVKEASKAEEGMGGHGRAD